MFKGKKKKPQTEEEILAWREQNRKMKEGMKRAEVEAKERREREERERIEREEREKREREEAIRREEERKRLEAERLERERLEREEWERQEAERRAREEQERIEREERERLERIEQQKRDAERRERERIEKEERAKRDREEKEERARLEMQRKEEQRLARIEQERVQRENEIERLRQQKEQRAQEEAKRAAEEAARKDDIKQRAAAPVPQARAASSMAASTPAPTPVAVAPPPARKVPRDVEVGEKYFLAWEFVAENEGEVSVPLDEPVELLSIVDDAWLMIRKLVDGEEGYLPHGYFDLNSFVETIPLDSASPEPEATPAPAASPQVGFSAQEENNDDSAHVPRFSGRAQTMAPNSTSSNENRQSVGVDKGRKSWHIKSLKRRKSISNMTEMAVSKTPLAAAPVKAEKEKKKEKKKDKGGFQFEISGPTGFSKKNDALPGMPGSPPVPFTREASPAPQEDGKLIICRALFDSDPEAEGEMMLREGDVVVVYDTSNGDWWQGTTRGETGFFPADFVEEMAKEDVPPKLLDQLRNAGAHV